MAQIWKVRLGGVSLGGLGATPEQKINTVGVLTNGVVAITGIVLVATKRSAEAYTLMIAAAVVGTALGIAKVYGTD